MAFPKITKTLYLGTFIKESQNNTVCHVGPFYLGLFSETIEWKFHNIFTNIYLLFLFMYICTKCIQLPTEVQEHVFPWSWNYTWLGNTQCSFWEPN